MLGLWGTRIQTQKDGPCRARLTATHCRSRDLREQADSRFETRSRVLLGSIPASRVRTTINVCSRHPVVGQAKRKQSLPLLHSTPHSATERSGGGGRGAPGDHSQGSGRSPRRSGDGREGRGVSPGKVPGGTYQGARGTASRGPGPPGYLRAHCRG